MSPPHNSVVTYYLVMLEFHDKSGTYIINTFRIYNDCCHLGIMWFLMKEIITNQPLTRYLQSDIIVYISTLNIYHYIPVTRGGGLEESRC